MASSVARRCKRAGCDLRMRPRIALTRVMASSIARQMGWQVVFCWRRWLDRVIHYPAHTLLRQVSNHCQCGCSRANIRGEATAFQRWWRYWWLPGVVNRQRIYRGVFASELGSKGRDSERCCCCCAWRVWMTGRAPHLAQSKYIGVFALELRLNGSDIDWCCCCSHWPPQRYHFTMRAGTGGVFWGCSKLLKRPPIYISIPKVLALLPVTLYIQNFTGQQEHCDCWYSEYVGGTGGITATFSRASWGS